MVGLLQCSASRKTPHSNQQGLHVNHKYPSVSAPVPVLVLVPVSVCIPQRARASACECVCLHRFTTGVCIPQRTRASACECVCLYRFTTGVCIPQRLECPKAPTELQHNAGNFYIFTFCMDFTITGSVMDAAPQAYSKQHLYITLACVWSDPAIKCSVECHRPVPWPGTRYESTNQPQNV